MLKHIETKRDYDEYEKIVANFFKKTGLSNLSLALAEDYDEESGEDFRYETEEPYFSWRFCEVCHRPLGGDRYICNGYIPEFKEISVNYEVCSDCYYYAEYGQLDDMTMMNLKDV